MVLEIDAISVPYSAERLALAAPPRPATTVLILTVTAAECRRSVVNLRQYEISDIRT